MLVVLFLDTLGVGIIIPVTPDLLRHFVGGDLTGSAHLVGVFFALYSIAQLIFAPLLGALSDRYGRRPVILLSLIGGALDYALLALAPSLPWLFLGRVVSGVTGANLSVGTAYIADVTEPERRAQAFGMIGVAFGLGFVLGPAAGGALGGLHLRAPFVVAGALTAVNALFAYFILPESLSISSRAHVSWARLNPFASFRRVTRSVFLSGLMWSLLAMQLAQQFLQSIYVLHTQARFGWTLLDIGESLTAVGVAGIVVQGVLVRRVVAALGMPATVCVGLLVNVVTFIGLGAASSGRLFFALMTIFSLGGLAVPALQALASAEVDESAQGELQGVFASIQSCAAVVGPVVATSLFQIFAAASSEPYVPGAAFYAAALLSLIGLMTAGRTFSVRRRERSTHAA